jgi:hypothetical protein
MKKFLLLISLLGTTSLLRAETTWYLFISTDPPHFFQAGERILSSTDTAKIQFPNSDSTFSCYASKPIYFQIEGIPYPLGVHRYLECDLGKSYAFAAEVSCALKDDDVHDTELLLQTPNLLYGLSFQCLNLVEGVKK